MIFFYSYAILKKIITIVYIYDETRVKLHTRTLYINVIPLSRFVIRSKEYWIYYFVPRIVIHVIYLTNPVNLSDTFLALFVCKIQVWTTNLAYWRPHSVQKGFWTKRRDEVCSILYEVKQTRHSSEIAHNIYYGYSLSRSSFEVPRYCCPNIVI